MYNSDSKSTIKLPEPSLRRLPWYLAYIKLLQTKGEEYVSSTQIAKEIGVDSSKIAKDLSFINISGKTRVGYEINSLVAVLEEFLGFTSMHKAFIFGVGSLGAALMQDSKSLPGSMSNPSWQELSLIIFRYIPCLNSLKSKKSWVYK